MSNEEYRECIIKLLERISDNEGLKRIYSLTNSIFVNQ